MNQKVDQWVEFVNKVSKAAVKAPQVAFRITAVQMGVVHRVVPDCADSFSPLQHAITTQSSFFLY